MIRVATRSDLNLINDLVLEFLTATSYDQHTQFIDREHIKRLVYHCLAVGKIWLYDINNETVGLLVALMEPNIWMPEKKSLKELIFYVKQEHRNSTAAGRLFKAFCDEGNQMLLNKQIDGYFTTRMGSTVDYDLTKRGFREVERLFLKD